MELGEILKINRENKGWTLRQLENKLNSKNVQYSHTSIKRLENNEHDKIPIKVLSALSDIYKLNKVELFNLAGASLEEIIDEDKKKLGVLLKQKREKLNYTLENIEKIFLKREIKISKTEIEKIEEGKKQNIDIKVLKILSEVYKLDFEEVFKLAGIDLKELSKIMNFRNDENTKTIPLFGSASAGSGYINLDVEIGEFLIPEDDYEKNCYAVKVVGNSMVGENGNIPDGAVALIRPYENEQLEIQEKKVYIFTYKEETYIKQLIIDKQKIMRLHSFNRDYEDIIILNPEDLYCHGKVIKIYYNMEF